MPSDNGRFLWLWFLLTALSVAYMAYEQLRPRHGEASRMKKLTWLLYTLYTGPFSLLVYWWSGRAIGSSHRERAAERL